MSIDPWRGGALMGLGVGAGGLSSDGSNLSLANVNGVQLITGLHADGRTDDSVLINAQISAGIAAGNYIFQLPAGKLALANSIVISGPVSWTAATNRPIMVYGAGRDLTTLFAIANLTVLWLKDTSYIQVGGVARLTLDGANRCTYVLDHQCGDRFLYDDLIVKNAAAGGTVMRISDNTHPAIENRVQNTTIIGADSAVYSSSQRPSYGLVINGTNNNVAFVKSLNSATANFKEFSGGAGNRYIDCHGYGYSATNQASWFPQYNFQLSYQSTIIGGECDGASVAQVNISTWQNVVSGMSFQWGGGATNVGSAYGIQFTGAAGAAAVHGNTFTDVTSANAIVATSIGSGCRVFGNTGASYVTGLVADHNLAVAGAESAVAMLLPAAVTSATSYVTLGASGGAAAALYSPALSVNGVGLNGAATSGGPSVAAYGADTNINLWLYGKGTGTASTNTPAAGDNSTKLATTAFVAASFATTAFVTASYAPLASPTFTGTVTLSAAVTAPAGGVSLNTANGKVAYLYAPAASVNSIGLNGAATGGTVTLSPLAGDANQNLGIYGLGTGAAITTTPTAGDNSTKLATTAFVASSYATLASPTFTGTVTLPGAVTSATSYVTLGASGGAVAALYSPASSVNGVGLNGAASGAAPSLAPFGPAANIDLTVYGKGTGLVRSATPTAGDNSTALATTAFVASSFAPLASPTFTGTVTLSAAVTAPAGGVSLNTANGKVAYLYAPAASVNSIGLNGAATGGTVTLSPLAGDANQNLGIYGLGTGAAITTTPTAGDNSTKLATTAFVAASFAPLASPTFTGTTAAPTPTAGDSTTKLATTAFVAASFAPLASPTFTGTTAAPTPAAGDNSTKLATTAFVAASFATTAFVTASYAPLASPTFTGTVTLPGAVTSAGTFVTLGASGGSVASLYSPASSVNGVGLNGAASGAAPSLASFGPATNIDLNINGKGTGLVRSATPTAGDNSTALATTAFVAASFATTAFVTASYAPLASPTFTGTVTLPGAVTSATSYVTLGASGGAVAALYSPASSVNGVGLSGAATGTAPNISTIGPAANIDLTVYGKGTGLVRSATPTAGDNSTALATTAFVAASFATTAFVAASYAPLASPTFTGTVTLPGAVTSATSYVTLGASGGAVAALYSPASSVNGVGLSGAATGTAPNISTIGPAANIDLTVYGKGTGLVRSATPTAGDNSTALATTAFVAASFAPLASPTFTGTVAAADLTVASTDSLANAWTARTAPAVTSAAGTITTFTSALRTKKLGRVVFFQLQITTPTPGTATGLMQVTMPNAAASSLSQGFGGKETTTGKGIAGHFAGTSTLYLSFADGGSIFAAGSTVALMTGVYESAS